MKIAIDGRRIRHNMSGLGVYSLNLIRSVTAAGIDDEFLIYLLPESLEYLPAPRENEKRVVVDWPVENHIRGDFWKHIQLPSYLKKEGVDLFHDPGYQLPYRRCSCKQVVTVLDLAPFRYPETNTWKYNVYWRTMTRLAIRRADMIVTISDFVREEIRDYFQLDGDRIHTVHLAAAPEFESGPVNPEILTRYGIPEQYIVTTAKFEPRKNLEGLLKAFHHYIKDLNGGATLVVAGEMGWKCEGVYRFLEESGLKERVIFTGYLPQHHLVTIIRGASLAVVPSVYEGFGLPVLEAMACGTPVLSANTASLPEVGGTAAVYCNPLDLEDMAEKIKMMLMNADTRGQRVEQGQVQARQFTWSRTANEMLTVYRSL